MRQAGRRHRCFVSSISILFLTFSGVPECEFLLNHDDCRRVFKGFAIKAGIPYRTDMFLLIWCWKTLRILGWGVSVLISIWRCFWTGFAESAQKAVWIVVFTEWGCVRNYRTCWNSQEGQVEGLAGIFWIMDLALRLMIFDPVRCHLKSSVWHVWLLMHAFLKFDHSLGRTFCEAARSWAGFRNFKISGVVSR